MENNINFFLFNKGDQQKREYIEEIKNTNIAQTNIKKRKYSVDNIKKKIKLRFFKELKNKVNQNLKIAGSAKYLCHFPCSFIFSLNKNESLDLTLKEVMSKCSWNLSVLDYLEKNETICQKSNFHIFANMKLYQIFNEYLMSKEFEKEILYLKKKKEIDSYIKQYIILAFKLVDYFHQK